MKYIFSVPQFFVLLSLAGIKQTVCIAEPGEGDESTIREAIIKLYSAGRIEEKNGQYVPKGELKTLMEQIKSAEYAISVRRTDSRFPQQILYSTKKDPVPVLEVKGGRDVRQIRFFGTERLYHVWDMFQNELLPAGMFQERQEAEKLEARALEDFPKQQDGETILEIERIQVSTGKAERRIEICQSLLFLWICVSGDGQETYRHLYSREEMAEMILEELGGSKRDSG